MTKNVTRLGKAVLVTLLGSLLVRRTATVALAAALTAGSLASAKSSPPPVDEDNDSESVAVDTLSRGGVGAQFVVPVGYRGSFDFGCFSFAGGVTKGLWTGSLHSETLHRRYPFTITCASNVNQGNPSGTWPRIPLAAGILTLSSQILTSTVIGGVTYEAPAVAVNGSAFVSGLAVTNLETGAGEVVYNLAVPLHVN